MPTVKKLFIGLPIYAQVPAFFLNGLLALQKQKPCELICEFCQGDGVARSRNQLAASFLATDCTHLLFIDCDMIFHPDHVARLIEHDEPIVCGLYPKKQEGAIEWVLNTLPGHMPKPDSRGLQKVRYAGTGFMLIRRDVFEKMMAAYPQIEFLADYGSRRVEHDFFSMGVYREQRNDPDAPAESPKPFGRYLSEDWYFCQRWLDLGGDILVDTKVVIKHIGTVVFPLGYQAEELFVRCAPKLPGGFTRDLYAASDEEAAREVFEQNAYRLPGAFKPGSIVVDIGAHIGAFTAAALSRGAAEIHAYEPDPENCVQLARNRTALDAIERVSIFEEAVWHHGSKVSFCARTDAGANKGEGSLLADRDHRAKITVQAVPIAEVFRRALARYDRIAFLKLDCEGSEYSILSHALIADLRRVDRIAAELHTDMVPRAQTDALVTTLLCAGFNVTMQTRPNFAQRTMLFAGRGLNARRHPGQAAIQPDLPEAPAATGDTVAPAEALAAGALSTGAPSPSSARTQAADPDLAAPVIIEA